MSPTDPRYSLTELADLAGVSPRTVRYYQSQGLLASPGVPGPGAKYDDDDLARLRLIRRLQVDHLPLAEIRRRLPGLQDEGTAGLAEARPPLSAAPPDSALEYVQRVLHGGHRVSEARPSAPLMRSMPPPSMSSTPSLQPAPEGPPSIERSQWERITLAPDIELHVRRPLTRLQSKQVDRLVSIARDLLEEDPS